MCECGSGFTCVLFIYRCVQPARFVKIVPISPISSRCPILTLDHTVFMFDFIFWFGVIFAVGCAAIISDFICVKFSSKLRNY